MPNIPASTLLFFRKSTALFIRPLDSFVTLGITAKGPPCGTKFVPGGLGGPTVGPLVGGVPPVLGTGGSVLPVLGTVGKISSAWLILGFTLVKSITLSSLSDCLNALPFCISDLRPLAPNFKPPNAPGIKLKKSVGSSVALASVGNLASGLGSPKKNCVPPSINSSNLLGSFAASIWVCIPVGIGGKFNKSSGAVGKGCVIGNSFKLGVIPNNISFLLFSLTKLICLIISSSDKFVISIPKALASAIVWSVNPPAW